MAAKRGLMGGIAVSCLGMAALASAADSPVPSGMAGKLVLHYHMSQVPQEGAWFSQSYSSDDQIDGGALPARYGGRSHAAGNAIVVVETSRDFSAMHRLQTDEVWHFYGGSALDLLLLFPDGQGRRVTLGPHVLSGEVAQLTVPRGVWQGSAPHDSSTGAYSFVGTQLSPGFDAADFEIGYRDELQRRFPAFARDIERLTRTEFAKTPAEAARRAESAEPRGAVIAAADVPAVAVSPGLTLQELVGRVAHDAKTTALSVAKFTLEPGSSSGLSLNHRAKEIFLVTDGTGHVRLGDRVVAVGRDSIVFIPAEVAHSIEADTSTLLSFYAISAPAFSPEDYVLIK
jgi:predicted cupin superfamily sugar epimerase/quercetin dioxygenase-like cupin family protein